MLNKKESLLRRDQAVSWLWACRKVGFNRDVARVIANHVFDGFKYLNGTVVTIHGGKTYILEFEHGRLCRNGDLLGSVAMDERRAPGSLCFVTLLGMMRRNFILDGKLATLDEKDTMVEILQDTECGVEVKVKTMVDGIWSTHFCRTFGDILRLSPELDWNFYGYQTDDDVDDNKPFGLAMNATRKEE